MCFKKFTHHANEVPSFQNVSDLLLVALPAAVWTVNQASTVLRWRSTVVSSFLKGGFNQSGSIHQCAITKSDKEMDAELMIILFTDVGRTIALTDECHCLAPAPRGCK